MVILEPACGRGHGRAKDSTVSSVRRSLKEDPFQGCAWGGTGAATERSQTGCVLDLIKTVRRRISSPTSKKQESIFSHVHSVTEKAFDHFRKNEALSEPKGKPRLLSGPFCEQWKGGLCYGHTLRGHFL